MKFVLISPKNRTVWNFRGDLVREIVARGWEVVVTGPDRTDVDPIEALGVNFVADGTIERLDEIDDVRPYYAACSVYVLPSWREGTPRTVLEAMACGRPVVTCDTQGCRETVMEGKNGFLVPVRDVEALADRMSWFVEHPDAIAPMAQASLALVRDRFDVRKVNADMLRIMGL